MKIQFFACVLLVAVSYSYSANARETPQAPAMRLVPGMDNDTDIDNNNLRSSFYGNKRVQDKTPTYFDPLYPPPIYGNHKRAPHPYLRQRHPPPEYDIPPPYIYRESDKTPTSKKVWSLIKKMGTKLSKKIIHTFTTKEGGKKAWNFTKKYIIPIVVTLVPVFVRSDDDDDMNWMPNDVDQLQEEGPMNYQRSEEKINFQNAWSKLQDTLKTKEGGLEAASFYKKHIFPIIEEELSNPLRRGMDDDDDELNRMVNWLDQMPESNYQGSDDENNLRSSHYGNNMDQWKYIKTYDQTVRTPCGRLFCS